MRVCTALGLMPYDKETGFSGTPLLTTLRRHDPRRLRAGAIALTNHGHWARRETTRRGDPDRGATR
jgi:hypothetical protein